jgi:hypothetical protein
MTAIAYSPGVMAADTLCTSSGSQFHSPKIIKHQGYLLGAAGDVLPLADLVRWYFSALGDPTRSKIGSFDFDLMVVTPKGKIELWDQRGICEPIPHKFWAVGCGAQCCLGAMEAGAKAPEAVRAAIKWTESVGGRVTVRKLK